MPILNLSPTKLLDKMQILWQINILDASDDDKLHSMTTIKHDGARWAGGKEGRAANMKHILGVYFFNVICHTNISAELHMPYACMSKEALKKSCFLRMVEVHPIDLCIVALIRLRKVALQEKQPSSLD